MHTPTELSKQLADMMCLTRKSIKKSSYQLSQGAVLANSLHKNLVKMRSIAVENYRFKKEMSKNL